MDWSDRGSDTHPLFASSSPRSPTKRFGAFTRSRSTKEREKSRIRRMAFRFDGLGSFEPLDWDRLKDFEKGRQQQQALQTLPLISPRDPDAEPSPQAVETPLRPVPSGGRTDSGNSLETSSAFYLPHAALPVAAAVAAADPAAVASATSAGLLSQPGGEFSWFHVEIPRSCPSLSAAARQLITHLHPPLQLQEITTLLSNGPYCGTLGGALFLRVNSPGPIDSPYTFKIAARITPYGIVSVALGPVPRLELQRGIGGQFGAELGLGFAGRGSDFGNGASAAVNGGSGADGAVGAVSAAAAAAAAAAAVAAVGSAASACSVASETLGAPTIRKRSPNSSFRNQLEGEIESTPLSFFASGISATVTPHTSKSASPSETPRLVQFKLGSGSSSLEATAIVATVAAAAEEAIAAGVSGAGGVGVGAAGAAAGKALKDPVSAFGGDVDPAIRPTSIEIEICERSGANSVHFKTESSAETDKRGLLHGIGSRSFGLGGSVSGGVGGSAVGSGVFARVGKVLEAITPRRREVKEEDRWESARDAYTINVNDADLEELLRKSHPEDADCAIPVTVFGLLQHIVETHIEHLEDVVVEVESMLDQHERDLDEGSDHRLRLLKDRTFPKLHLDLQRVLQSLAHGEVVLPKLKDRLVARRWCAGPVASAVLEGTMARLRRGKENVGFLSARITALQTGLDQWQSEQINKKLYYLSFLSIVFLPLSIITGAFGMNVGGVPWVPQTTDDPKLLRGFVNVMWICLYVVIALVAAFAAPTVYTFVTEKVQDRQRIVREARECVGRVMRFLERRDLWRGRDPHQHEADE